jgi:hypothetical protein
MRWVPSRTSSSRERVERLVAFVADDVAGQGMMRCSRAIV